MDFSKYLRFHNIPKVIDPGDNSSGNTPNITPEQLAIRSVTNTPIATRVSNIIQLSQSVQSQVANAISNISQANSSNPDFVLYQSMVQANSFNPAILIQNPTATPSAMYTANQIKAAERLVYRNSTDPRAPFIQDLTDMASDAGLSQYALTQYWQKIVAPNSMYSSYNDSEPLTRMVLDQEEQHLQIIQDSTQRIQSNTLQGVSSCFLQAFSQKISNQIQTAIPALQINNLNTTINTLTQIRNVLYVTLILNTQNWEMFAGNLKDMNSNWLQNAANKLASLTSFPFIGGMQPNITSFLTGFGSIAPQGCGSNILDSQELMSQVDNVFGHFLAKIEDDLIAKEGKEAKLEENRQLMYLNSRKNSKTKQFLSTLDATIAYLQQLSQTLSNNSPILINTAVLSQNLITNSNTYKQSVMAPLLLNQAANA